VGVQPVLEGAQAQRAIAVAREVAGRLRDPEAAERHGRRAREELSAAVGRPLGYDPASAGNGATGLAVLCAQLDATFPGEAWDHAGREHLVRASASGAGDDAKRRMPLGLWTGAAGLAFAACLLSRDGTRYATMRARLENAVAVWSTDLAAHWSPRLPGLPVEAWDLVSGLTGTGALLLSTRDGTERKEAALLAVLEMLVAASREDTAGVPGWHTPRRLVPPGADTGTGDRVVNCGVAHGAPGALALLAVAHRSGVAVDGLPEAIDRTARWLLAHAVDTPWGPEWPNWAGAPVTIDRPGRAGWCYGTPGVARSLWLAGDSLDDAGLREAGRAALEAVLARTDGELGLDSPTVCHGVAGLLLIAVRMAADTGDPGVRAAAQQLAKRLVDAHDPEAAFGYRSIERDRELDAPGLLAGVAGIPLALLAAATDQPPVWDRLLLLS